MAFLSTFYQSFGRRERQTDCLLPGVCGRTEDGPAVAGAPAEGAALRGEGAPLGRAGAAPDAPRRVGGLAKYDVVEADKGRGRNNARKMSR